MKSINAIVPGLFILLMACSNGEEQVDAYGNFEAVEVMVSAETQGVIDRFGPREGDLLKEGQEVVVIDSTQLTLKKIQLQSGMASIRARIHTLDTQVRASMVQLENLERERQRIDKLLEGGAATTKQRDDIKGQIDLLKAQIDATGSQKALVHAERQTLEIQIRQVEDQIMKCTVRNPLEGIMLTKYRERGEMAAPGQPLYKIANLDELILRAYISGNQLSSVQTGAKVRVRFDAPEGTEELTGVVSWISAQAEFTPKIIQTREERVNLVYAIKVIVPNDGRLKIGMPGEVIF
jgi:HlyD family secretion protein